MKQVLLICQHFIPYTQSVGGVARVLSIAQELINNDYTVHILSSNGVDFGYLGYGDLHKKVHVFYINDIYKAKTQQSMKPKKKLAEKFSPKSVDVLTNFAKKIAKEILVPDSGIFVIKKYVKKAEEIIQKNNIPNVIVSSPPHSMQIVGLRLKEKNKDLNLIVDYRDSWNQTTIFKHNSYLANLISTHFEKKVLKICDHFTYASSPILNKIEKNYKVNISPKSTLILNGFNDYGNDGLFSQNYDFNVKTKRRASGLIKIGYFGIANDSRGYRNISNLIASFKNNSFLQENFSLEFYGHLELNSHRFDELPFLTFHGNFTHGFALSKMKEMDYLLLLHSDKENSDEVITGKFFDYAQSKIKILCLSPFDMEARRLIEKYNLGIWIDVNDLKDISEKLMTLAKAKQFENPSTDVDVSCFSRRTQNFKFLKILR